MTVSSRLLHPQHLDGIWIGQNQYRLPYAPLSEYPEPWFWKVADGQSRALASLGALRSKTWGWNGVEKNRVQKFLDTYTPYPPMSGTFFFKASKTANALDTPSCNFSEPGFWVLTKGGIRQPVLYQPYPNSIQVLRMEQPSSHTISKSFLKKMQRKGLQFSRFVCGYNEL